MTHGPETGHQADGGVGDPAGGGSQSAADAQPGGRLLGDGPPESAHELAERRLAEQQLGDARITELQQELGERTADLQRLQAEYVNYKRRVERDRETVRETATATVLGGLVPVLDDIERARSHGELTGGFKAVAEGLERALVGLGLVRYGEAGEPFDPRVHEALTHAYDDSVRVTTAQAVLQPGYRLGERVLRPAMVAVAEPVDGQPPGPVEGDGDDQAPSV